MPCIRGNSKNIGMDDMKEWAEDTLVRNHTSPNEGWFIIRLNWVDLITLSSVIWSSFSVVASFSNRFEFAISFLFMAMFCDGIDGVLARKFGLERAFGRYLDSSVDVLIYLAAPAVFLFCWGFAHWVYGFVLILFIMCGVVRLSVFNQIGNINGSKIGELRYLGMPTYWSVFFIGIIYLAAIYLGKYFIFPILAVLLLIYSFLMIYNASFFKFQNIGVMLSLPLAGATIFAFMGFGQTLVLQQFLAIAITALFLTVPIVVGGVLHMVVVAKDLLGFLAIPVQKRLFGPNKTWRGIIVMPIVTIAGVWLARFLEPTGSNWLLATFKNTSVVEIGVFLGFSYTLFELPNSFIKRRLNIAPGELPKRFRFCFILLDQVDSAFGFALVYFLLLDVHPLILFVQIILHPLVAISVKRILYILKLKRTAF